MAFLIGTKKPRTREAHPDGLKTELDYPAACEPAETLLFWGAEAEALAAEVLSAGALLDAGVLAACGWLAVTVLVESS